MVEEGRLAPAFELPASSGGWISLRALRGGAVALYFYPSDDTSACALEAQRFSALASQFAAAGASIIGVSPDGLASHCRFRDKYNLNLVLASDEDRKSAGPMGYGPRSRCSGANIWALNARRC